MARPDAVGREAVRVAVARKRRARLPRQRRRIPRSVKLKPSAADLGAEVGEVAVVVRGRRRAKQRPNSRPSALVSRRFHSLIWMIPRGKRNLRVLAVAGVSASADGAEAKGDAMASRIAKTVQGMEVRPRRTAPRQSLCHRREISPRTKRFFPMI
jgi:hypothetical protein